VTYDHWKSTNPADNYLGPDPDDENEYDRCPTCDGAGVLEDECECMAFSDQCYCLVPSPPVCPECGGRG
jgi:hypothetical protein